MTTPRSYQIDLSATPYYHCVARCVRRSFLCGYDNVTNKDFSHRRQWILDRIKHLSKVFYIDICAYAIMSNHYHLVLHVDSHNARKASLEDLLYRWHLIFPSDAVKLKKLIACSNEDLKNKIVKMLQERLADISWYMRSLNEIIAKMANKEDECKGRFWEGRFKSQALLDEGALLCAMAYVDLNPIRAGIANTPEFSEYTSIQERIQHYRKTLDKSSTKLNEIKDQPADLIAFSCFREKTKPERNTIDFALKDYLSLVDTTGRLIREDKKGSIPEHFAPILDRLQLTSEGWLKMISGIERNFHYAIGNVVYLKEFIPSLIHRRSKCVDFVEQCYQAISA